MALSVAFMITVIGLACGLGYLFHIGWGPRLRMMWDAIKKTGELGWDHFADFYFSAVLPGNRHVKNRTPILIGFIAVAASFTGLSEQTMATVWVVAVIGTAYVLLTELEGRVEKGRAEIIPGANFVDVQYAAFDERPIVEIKPFDPNDEFSIRRLTDTGFTIHLPVVATERHVYTYRAATRPTGMPILNIAGSVIVAFLGLAITLFGAGIVCNNRAAILLSITPLAVAAVLFFTILRFFVWVAEKSAGILEFAPNALIQVTFAAIRRDWGSVQEFFDRITDSKKQAANLVNQEEFKKWYRKIVWMTVAGLASTYLLAINFPIAAGFWSVAQVCGLLLVTILEYREFHFLSLIKKSVEDQYPADPSWHHALRGVRVRLTAIRLASLSLMMLVTFVGLGLLFLRMFFGAGDAIDALWLTFGDLVRNVVLGGKNAMTSGMTWLASCILAGLVVAGMLAFWPSYYDEWNRKRYHASGTHWVGTSAFALIALVSMCLFIWSQVGETVTDKANSVKSGLWKGFVPTVRATETESKPGAHVSWQVVPAATGYKIERRELREATYGTIKDAKGEVDLQFDKGTTAYQDDTVKREKTYFYRVVAIGGNGTGMDLVSDERSVAIPKEPEFKKLALEKPTVAVAPATTVAGCTNGDCGTNPGLNAYCARHPKIEGCR